MYNRVPWENDVLTVRQLLNHTAQKYDTKICIKYENNANEDVSRTYKDMRDDSIAIAVALKKAHCERENIALIAKTSYNYLTALNGIMSAGNVAIPLSPGLTEKEIEKILIDCDASAVFCDNDTIERVRSVANRVPLLDRIYSIDDEDVFDLFYCSYLPAEECFLPEENPDDTTIIIYTSGTTGSVKGACLSSRAIISNIYFKEMNFEGDNIALNVLPMHHIFCFSCDYLKNLKDGVCICLNGDISNIKRNLIKYEPTIVRLVPMIVDTLYKQVYVVLKKNPELSKREAAERVFGHRIKNIIVSGAAFVAKIADDFEEMGIEVRQGYGMTETGPRIAVPDGNTCAESGGRVISLCDIRISAEGEIQVRSPSIMTEYYKKPQETVAVFTDDGWFKTGDIGRLTENRELFITGRIKNIIILSNGENVSPESIEKELSKNPIIKEILVFGEKNILCADVFPDYEYATSSNIDNIESAIKKVIDEYNNNCEPVKMISCINVSCLPLQKTSTGKILRNKNQI